MSWAIITLPEVLPTGAAPPPTTVFRRTLSQYGSRPGVRQAVWGLLLALWAIGL